MKVKKEALRSARLLLKASMPGGRVDTARAAELTRRIVAEKPRRAVQILVAFRRLLRLELDKRHAVIESAHPLDDASRARVLAELTGKFGPDLTSEFKVIPDLVGGLRIKLGSMIWDGSIRTRLETMSQALGI
ncbi:MAG: FoF1 ATP synthase subunit delta [Verrucomicrobiales bacterium]